MSYPIDETQHWEFDLSFVTMHEDAGGSSLPQYLNSLAPVQDEFQTTYYTGLVIDMETYWKWLGFLAGILTIIFTVVLIFVCCFEFDKETPFERRRRQFLYSIRRKID